MASVVQPTQVLYRFRTQADLAVWDVFSDKTLGGCTEASLALREGGEVRAGRQAGAARA